MQVQQIQPRSLTQVMSESGCDDLLKNLHSVFRVVRLDEMENINEGIFAKDTESLSSAVDHVRSGKKNTAWISVTDNFISAIKWAIESNCSIAVIDFSKITTECIDFRKGFPGERGTQSMWAVSSRELCVRNRIEATAIITVIAPAQLRAIMMENREYKALMDNAKNPYKACVDATVRRVTTMAQDLATWENPLVLVLELQKLWTARKFVWRNASFCC